MTLWQGVEVTPALSSSLLSLIICKSAKKDCVTQQELANVTLPVLELGSQASSMAHSLRSKHGYYNICRVCIWIGANCPLIHQEPPSLSRITALQMNMQPLY